VTLNTLRLLLQILVSQPLNLGASRDEIEAVLAARDELEAAIADAE
jgi:hypothetical protein